jgi:hypothetical protein
MYSVELYARVRRACHVDGLSERAAARLFGIDRKTVSKILEHSVPPGYRRSKPPGRPKLDPFIPIIDQILEADRSLPKKQRHTAQRIFERLRDEHGFTGGITIVTDYIREKKRRTQEVFVPLSHPPGHAQVDFGEALGEIGGVRCKLHSFAMALPHSDAFFIKAYPAETTEACLATATSRPSPSSAACRCRSCTTTPNSQWRRSWATGPATRSHGPVLRRAMAPFWSGIDTHTAEPSTRPVAAPHSSRR